MTYKMKNLPVLVTKKLGKYLVTDHFGKTTEYEQTDFYRYVELSATATPETNNVRTTVAQAVDLLNNDEVSEAISLLNTIV